MKNYIKILNRSIYLDRVSQVLDLCIKQNIHKAIEDFYISEEQEDVLVVEMKSQGSCAILNMSLMMKIPTFFEAPIYGKKIYIKLNW